MSMLAGVPFTCKPRHLAIGFPLPAQPCECTHPINDTMEPGHCYRCGHDDRDVIEDAWAFQASRTWGRAA